MEIDVEGHILVTPREICDGLEQPNRLINDVLIPGTPLAFPTYRSYCDFLSSFADLFGIHPRSVVVRGSTKIGFSVSPDPDSIWVAMHSESDLDMAIIDSDYYHYLDREIRMWERNPANKAFERPGLRKSIARRQQRAYYVCRYFDLPKISCVAEHNARLKSLPVEACCGFDMQVDTFVFRDWWSLYSRWEFDLRELRRAIVNGLPRGENMPRAYNA